MEISDFGKNFLLICLRMNKLIEGYVDAYFGPKSLLELVINERPLPLKQLMKSLIDLQSDLKNQGFPRRRVTFLEKTLEAMKVSLEVKIGKKIPYLEYINKLYDITPKIIDDSIFYDAIKELNSLYDGSGKLIDRIIATRSRREITQEDIIPAFQKAFNLLRKQTLELFPKMLPISEDININIVKNQPWSAYNWYLGEYKSRIDVNTDLPVLWTNILSLVAHEGYPGHHTHNVVKEKLLYNDKNWFEHSVLLISTPEAVISEGIANTGINVLFSSDEITQIALDYYCVNPHDEDFDVLKRQTKIWKKLSGFSGNLAIHAHVDGWTDDQLKRYGLSFGFLPENNLSQRLKFIRDPLWATYVFTYYIGEMMIKKKFGERPSPADFKMLLCDPILPSDIV